MLAQSEIYSSWWTKYFKMADLGNNFWKGFWMSSKNKRLATKKRRQVSWVWKCSQSCRTTNHKHVLSKPEINHSMLSSSWRSHCCNWFLRFFPPQIKNVHLLCYTQFFISVIHSVRLCSGRLLLYFTPQMENHNSILFYDGRACYIVEAASTMWLHTSLVGWKHPY